MNMQDSRFLMQKKFFNFYKLIDSEITALTQAEEFKPE